MKDAEFSRQFSIYLDGIKKSSCRLHDKSEYNSALICADIVNLALMPVALLMAFSIPVED